MNLELKSNSFIVTWGIANKATPDGFKKGPSQNQHNMPWDNMVYAGKEIKKYGTVTDSHCLANQLYAA